MKSGGTIWITDVVGLAGGEFVPDALARGLALTLRECEQDVAREPAHRRRGIELLEANIPIRTLRNISLNLNFGGEVIVISLG